MAICPPGIPFLHKDAAAAVALELIEDSVAESRGLIGLLEFDGRDGVVGWCPPASGRRTLAAVDHEVPAARRAQPTASRRCSSSSRSIAAPFPSASFVFVLSDFIEPTPLATWEWALDRGWDVVPVVIQDPIWEQGFPDVDRLVLPLVGRGRPRARRPAREGRVAALARAARGAARALVDGLALARHRAACSSREEDREHVFGAFLDWSTERQASWGHAA